MILFVERWSTQGRPTPSARLVLARAYLHLRLLDRAWIRIKELLDRRGSAREATHLATELFWLRGWVDQARDTALRGLEDRPDDEVLRLLLRRIEEQIPPDPEALSPEEKSSKTELIEAAEIHMARGSFVRARGLLERVRRGAQPRKVPRAEELLWALRGEFTTETPLLDLYRRLAPGHEPEPTVPLSPPEPTEIAGLGELSPGERDDQDGFRGLFRDLAEAAEAAEDNDEVTAISQLAPPETLSGPSEDPADSEDTDPSHSHTEIMRIVRKGEPLRLARGSPLHTTPPEIDKSFDLEDYRRQLGVEAPVPGSDYAIDRDEEDDSLIIVTGHAGAQELDDTALASAVDVDRDAAREDEARGIQGVVDESWARPPAPDLETTQPLERSMTQHSPRGEPELLEPELLEPELLEPELSASDLELIEPLSWVWGGVMLALVLVSSVVLFGILSMFAAL